MTQYIFSSNHFFRNEDFFFRNLSQSFFVSENLPKMISSYKWSEILNILWNLPNFVGPKIHEFGPWIPKVWYFVWKWGQNSHSVLLSLCYHLNVTLLRRIPFALHFQLKNYTNRAGTECIFGTTTKIVLRHVNIK